MGVGICPGKQGVGGRRQFCFFGVGEVEFLSPLNTRSRVDLPLAVMYYSMYEKTSPPLGQKTKSVFKATV